MWLDSASLHTIVTVIDPKIDSSGQTYSIALWVDAGYAGGNSGVRELPNEKLMMLVSSKREDTLARVDWYSLDGSSLNSDPNPGAFPTTFTLLQRAYSFKCSIPRERIGFVPEDSIPAICGFLMEVFDRGTTEVSLRVTPSLTILGPGCNRLDPSTWFTLVEGIRKDTVYIPKQR